MADVNFNPACDGKVRIDTEAHAREGARRRGNRAPYFCRHCGSWHTGTVGTRDTRMKPYHRAPPGTLRLVVEPSDA